MFDPSKGEGSDGEPPDDFLSFVEASTGHAIPDWQRGFVTLVERAIKENKRLVLVPPPRSGLLGRLELRPPSPQVEGN